jgi:hypothetical protein
MTLYFLLKPSKFHIPVQTSWWKSVGHWYWTKSSKLKCGGYHCPKLLYKYTKFQKRTSMTHIIEIEGTVSGCRSRHNCRSMDSDDPFCGRISRIDHSGGRLQPSCIHTTRTQSSLHSRFQGLTRQATFSCDTLDHSTWPYPRCLSITLHS